MNELQVIQEKCLRKVSPLYKNIEAKRTSLGWNEQAIPYVSLDKVKTHGMKFVKRFAVVGDEVVPLAKQADFYITYVAIQRCDAFEVKNPYAEIMYQ